MKKNGLKKIVALALAFVLISTLVCGCGEDTGEIADNTLEPERTPEVTATPKIEETPTENCTLHLSVSKTTSWNPVTTANKTVSTFMSLICEPLFKMNDVMEPECCLATGYACDKEYKIWEISIITGAQFADGTYLTASTVVKSYEYARKTGNYKTNFENVAGFFAKDAYTIQAVLYESDANFIERLDVPVLSEKSCYDTVPDGTGPFKIESYAADSKVILVKNDAYHGTYNSHITRIEISIYENEYLALTSDYDMAFIYDGNIADYVMNGERTIGYITGNIYNYVAINTSDTYFVKVTEQVTTTTEILDPETGQITTQTTTTSKQVSKEVANPFGNVNMRKMLNLIVSRAQAITAAGSGNGTISLLPSYTGTADYVESVDDIAVDTFTADQYIRGCGYVKNADGKYEDENGELVSVSILTLAGNSKLSNIARVVRDALEDIGITATVESVTESSFKSKTKNNEYLLVVREIELHSWQNFSYVLKTGGKYNFSNYSSEVTDEKIAILENISDSEIKKETGRLLEVQVLEDCPIIGLYISENAIVMGKNMGGIRTNDIYPWDLLSEFENWYVRAEE